MACCEIVCQYSLQDFIILCNDESGLLEFLFKHRVLPRVRNCCACDVPMSLSLKQKHFRCHKYLVIKKPKQKAVRKTCRKTKSLLLGTCFENTHLPLPRICFFIAYWCHIKPTQEFFVNELKFSSKTVVDWIHFLREICVLETMFTRDEMGGSGKVVELYEAKFGKKYRHGGSLIGNWIYVAFERDSNKIFASSVPDRTMDTLYNVIEANILPGTTIVNNVWLSCQELGKTMIEQLTVNHAYNFTDKILGMHTQYMKDICRKIGSDLPKYRDRHYVAEDLCEFLFRYKYFKDPESCLHSIFSVISKWYNGTPW